MAQIYKDEEDYCY